MSDTTVADLLDTLDREYQINRRRSLYELRYRIRNHLLPAFGGRDPRSLTALDLLAYAGTRQQSFAANATINRELAALRRAFTLHGVPWPRGVRFVESPPREVAYTDEEFARLHRQLAAWTKPAFKFAWITGWRLHSEVLRAQWTWVTFGGRGYVRMPAGLAKNRDGRKFPFTPELRALLLAQQARTPAGCPWVFHRRGKPLRSVRTAFEKARSRAGLDGKTIHDLRRSAARRMHDRGVSETAMMKLIGWRDISTARRYNFRDDRDLYEAVKLLN